MIGPAPSLIILGKKKFLPLSLSVSDFSRVGAHAQWLDIQSEPRLALGYEQPSGVVKVRRAQQLPCSCTRGEVCRRIDSTVLPCSLTCVVPRGPGSSRYCSRDSEKAERDGSSTRVTEVFALTKRYNGGSAASCDAACGVGCARDRHLVAALATPPPRQPHPFAQQSPAGRSAQRYVAPRSCLDAAGSIRACQAMLR